MKGTKVLCIFTCVLVVLVVSANPTCAQQKGAGTPPRVSMGYFIGGVGWAVESGGSTILYSNGGGGHVIANRWVLGGEGHGVFGPGNAGGFGFVNLGYAVVMTDLLVLYPLLGVGGGSLTREASPSVSRCGLLNPAVGVDLMIPILGDVGGLQLGLRGGYTFTVYSDSFNWSLPYVRVVVGMYGPPKADLNRR